MALRNIVIDTEIMRQEIAATIQETNRLIHPQDASDASWPGLYADHASDQDFAGDFKATAEDATPIGKAIMMQALARAIVTY